MSKYDAPSMSWADWKQLFHCLYPSKPAFTEKDYPSLDGKVVAITGANTGIGYDVAKLLAGSTNAKIYIFARSPERTLEAIKRLEVEVAKEFNKTIGNEIVFIQVDLSNLETIKPAVEKFLSLEDRLDIIILNAGVMDPPVGSKSAQGYELQLGTNAIGHHLLQKLLDPICIETAKKNPANESRIVWVSSSGHLFSPRGGFNFDSPNFEDEKVSLNHYAQSKAVNAVQARYWPKVHPDSGIVSVSLCPGLLSTDLARSYGPILRWIAEHFLYAPKYGAYTELYAALSPDVTTANNGDHYISFGVLAHLREDLKDDESNKKIWEYLEKQVEPYV